VPIVNDAHIMGTRLAKEADARRDELDHMRRIPADLFKRAGDADLFRQLVCKDRGGLGRSPAEWFCTGVEMARWEPSFAWVVTQGAGDMATYIAAGDPAFTSALLQDQRAYIASSDNTVGSLVPENDGFRFAGRWGFCSGCHGATWVGGRGQLPASGGEEAPESRLVLVPMARARIEETWDVIGMIGTGSHSVVVEAQHIPAAWTFRIERHGSVDYGAMSVAAGNGIWPIATSVAAVQLGMARRVLDATAALAMKKTGAFRTRPLIENAHVQRELMRAEGAWFACRAGVEQALERLWSDADKCRRLPLSTRLGLVAANVHASATAMQIIESMCDIVGTSIAPAGGLFGARLRDARTLGSHASVSGAMLEMAAQLRAGLAQDNVWI